MKKIGFLIRNLYRITIVKSAGGKSATLLQTDHNDDLDIKLKNIIQHDPDTFDPDPVIYNMLEERLASKKGRIIENSFPGFITTLFSIRNFELKMALISFIVIISLGINPSIRYQANRNTNSFFLADTLTDSIRLHKEFYYQVPEQR